MKSLTIWFFRAFILAVSLIVCLIFLEILLRVQKQPTEPLMKSHMPGFFYQLAPNKQWSTSFTQGISYSNTGKIELKTKSGAYRTNAWGLRGSDFTLDSLQHKERILCIGDSITFGAFVDEPDTFEAQLSRDLEEREPGHYAVINAGIGGWNLWDYKAQFDLLVPVFKPDTVVIGLYMNDHIPWTKLDRIDLRGDLGSQLYFHLHGLRDQIWWFYRRWKYPWRQTLAKTIDPESVQSITTFVEATGGHPTFPTFVAWIIERITNLPQWESALKIVDQMKQTCDNNHIHLVVLIIPTSFQIQYGYKHPEPQRFINHYLSAHHVDHIDLRPILEKGCTINAEPCYYNVYDTAHFNARGHRLVAHALRGWLDRIGPQPIRPLPLNSDS